MNDEIRVMTVNLEEDGGGGEAWRRTMELVRDLKVDILLRQEMTHSARNGHQLLHNAESMLGMRGFGQFRDNVVHPTGMFVRPETFEVTGSWYTRRHDTFYVPPTNITVRLKGARCREIVLVSWHLAYNSSQRRAAEAEELATIADAVGRGYAFIGGGDCNEYPVAEDEVVPPIDWPSVTDRAHFRHRTVKDEMGIRVSATGVDVLLRDSGLVDAARYNATQGLLWGDSPLAATAGQARPDQGGPARIDRVYMDPWSVQSVKQVRVVHLPDSDHDGVLVVLDKSRFAWSLGRETDPASAW